MGEAELRRAKPARANARTQPVIAVIRAEVLADSIALFEDELAAFAAMVRTRESGCTSYAVTRLLGSPAHFAVHARFSCWHAFQRHAVTRHMKRAMPRLSALLAAPVSLEIFMEM